MKVRLTVAYDGTPFKGWAQNRNIRSVSVDLAAAIETVLQTQVKLTVAGRTDAGVHAHGQVVSFPVHDAFDETMLRRLVKGINSLCAPSIVVVASAIVADAFDARRSATSRRYRYLMLNTNDPDPFLASRAWHVSGSLNLSAMKMACDPLIGEHDFAAFCRQAPPPNNSTVRHVFSADWTASIDGMLQFDIVANAFCHQQVRALVGMMAVVGRGDLTPGDVMGLLAKRDRVRMPDLAPAHGLYLMEVRYDGRRVHP